MVIDGAMNAEMFLADVEQCLAPTLRRADIVIMDNVNLHKGAGVREAIEKVGATLSNGPNRQMPRCAAVNSQGSPARRQDATCCRHSGAAAVKRDWLAAAHLPEMRTGSPSEQTSDFCWGCDRGVTCVTCDLIRRWLAGTPGAPPLVGAGPVAASSGIGFYRRGTRPET
jgi:hypothetical protein